MSDNKINEVEFIKKEEKKEQNFFEEFNFEGKDMPNPLPKDSESKNIATLTHLSNILFFTPIVPVILYFVKKDDPFVLENAKEDINTYISYLAYCAIASLLIIVLIGALILFGLMVSYVIYFVLMALASSEGKIKRMPFVIRLIK